jgi:hypothetical protein
MKIRDIRLTPLHCPLMQSYQRSECLTHRAPVVPIKAETDGGITGMGECSESPAHALILSILGNAQPKLVPGHEALPISGLPASVSSSIRMP